MHFSNYKILTQLFLCFFFLIAVSGRAAYPMQSDSSSNPCGNFSLEAPDSISTPNIHSSITTADLNRDGVPDLIVTIPGLQELGLNYVTIYLGNNDGSFQPGKNFFAGAAPEDVAVGDFNRDGELDLARIEARHVDDVLAGPEVPDHVDAVTLGVVVGVLAVVAVEVVSDRD